MDQIEFATNFGLAHEGALSFARELVIQNLPDVRRFLLYPNQSYDGNTLRGDEQIYPRDSLAAGHYLGPLAEAQVLAWLWRDGKVPEWINVAVVAQDETFTYFELLCCGRYAAQDENLYYRHHGCPPFHILGPHLPIGWKTIKESGKFNLYWHGRVPI